MAIDTIVIFGIPRGKDKHFPADLKVGDIFDVYASGLIRCPTIGLMWNAPNIAIPADVSDGPAGWDSSGGGLGTTLYSADSVSGLRRIFRITVR